MIHQLQTSTTNRITISFNYWNRYGNRCFIIYFFPFQSKPIISLEHVYYHYFYYVYHFAWNVQGLELVGLILVNKYCHFIKLTKLLPFVYGSTKKHMWQKETWCWNAAVDSAVQERKRGYAGKPGRKVTARRNIRRPSASPNKLSIWQSPRLYKKSPRTLHPAALIFAASPTKWDTKTRMSKARNLHYQGNLLRPWPQKLAVFFGQWWHLEPPFTCTQITISADKSPLNQLPVKIYFFIYHQNILPLTPTYCPWKSSRFECLDQRDLHTIGKVTYHFLKNAKS